MQLQKASNEKSKGKKKKSELDGVAAVGLHAASLQPTELKIGEGLFVGRCGFSV